MLQVYYEKHLNLKLGNLFFKCGFLLYHSVSNSFQLRCLSSNVLYAYEPGLLWTFTSHPLRKWQSIFSKLSIDLLPPSDVYLMLKFSACTNSNKATVRLWLNSFTFLSFFHFFFPFMRAKQIHILEKFHLIVFKLYINCVL